MSREDDYDPDDYDPANGWRFETPTGEGPLMDTEPELQP